jgi:hypothetical protein
VSAPVSPSTRKIAAETSAPDCRTMNRQADSPFGLLVGITQMPAMDGTFASEAAGGMKRFA